MLQPFDNVVLISAAKGKDGDETLFQLPRTDNFLRAFAKMAYVADQMHCTICWRTWNGSRGNASR